MYFRWSLILTLKFKNIYWQVVRFGCILTLWTSFPMKTVSVWLFVIFSVSHGSFNNQVNVSLRIRHDAACMVQKYSLLFFLVIIVPQSWQRIHIYGANLDLGVNLIFILNVIWSSFVKAKKRRTLSSLITNTSKSISPTFNESPWMMSQFIVLLGCCLHSKHPVWGQ